MPSLDLLRRPCPVCGGCAEQVVARGQDYEYMSCDNSLTFVRCESCSAVYLNPRPKLDDFDIIYPESYYSSLEAEGDGRGAGRIVKAAWELVESHRTQTFRELLGSAERQTVLDIGCGDGRLLRVLRKILGPGHRLVGVERGLRRHTIEAAAQSGIELHDGVYEEMDFPEQSFDLIVAQQVIEHTVEPGKVLAKSWRELVSGGYAVFDTPNYEGFDRRLFSDGLWGGYHFPRHLTLFSPESFARLANSVGFEVTQVRPLLSPVFWIMSLHNLAVSRGLPRWVTSKLTYRSFLLLSLATMIDLPTLIWSGETSNMRAIVRKAEHKVDVA